MKIGQRAADLSWDCITAAIATIVANFPVTCRLLSGDV